MSNTNEILTKVILTLCSFMLGILSAIVGIGLAVESHIEEALTVSTKESLPLSSDSNHSQSE